MVNTNIDDFIVAVSYYVILAHLQSKVTFDYEPKNEHELRLREGDIVTVLDRNTGDKAFWKGELNGQVGLYPHNFTVRHTEVWSVWSPP